jgi:DNA-binding SARP family transcriptional activator
MSSSVSRIPARRNADAPASGARPYSYRSGDELAHLRLRLALLNGFELRSGDDPVSLPMAAQRVIAFLALQARPVSRPFVVGHLWIDASDERGTAALRTTLWRLGPTRCAIVSGTGQTLGLAPCVAVDLDDALARARSVIDHPQDYGDDDRELLCAAGELLPDWYDDWVLVERERFRQLRLHALEALCGALAAEGRFAQATDAGLAAVAGEPLRESAHRALIAAYLAEGNAGEALRQYVSFRRLLVEQLGLAPSSLMESLIDRVRRS